MGREYREIADWLLAAHGLTRWWAQKLSGCQSLTPGTRPEPTGVSDWHQLKVPLEG